MSYDLDAIRTHYLLLRRQLLYPSELRGLKLYLLIKIVVHPMLSKAGKTVYQRINSADRL